MTRALRALALMLAVWLALPVLPAAADPAPTTIYTLTVADSDPVAGRATDFTAVLGSGDAAVSGVELTLWLRPYGASAFVAAGQATTDVNGSATVWVTLQHDVQVQWTFAGNPDYAPSTSTAYLLPVAPRVTIRVNDRTLRRGQRFVVRGQSSPAKIGCTVKLWRGELRPLVQGPSPVRLAVSSVRSDGSYRLVRRFHHRARMRVAVTISPCAGNSRGLSSYVRIRVR